MYAAFTARDTDAVLAKMAPEVEWPKAFEGGVVVGKQAVREYWARQWGEIDPTVEPTAFAHGEDGRVVVTVAQAVRSLDGAVIAEGEVLHVYAFDEAGLIASMEIAEAG